MANEHPDEVRTRTPTGADPTSRRTGISNRESAQAEAAEREAHPREPSGRPDAEDASGRIGNEEQLTTDGGQTAHKAGSRSVAQKEAESRYPDRSQPPSRKVAGAFGREPQENRDGDDDTR